MKHTERPDVVDASDRGDGLVVFGLTGDLGDKELYPALAQLAAHGHLPHRLVVVTRSGIGVDEVRGRIADAAEGVDSDVVEAAASELDLRDVTGEVDDESTWEQIAEQLAGCHVPIVYTALPPDLVGATASRLAASDLSGRARLVVEKPFGHDLPSAERLWNEITALIDPHRLFVVDHFLANAAIENLATVRTCNAVIANNLQPGLVDRIDVVLHEVDGVDGRGSFYESVGAVRDVVQNHLLQMLAIATMRAPTDESDAAFLLARQELLDAIEPVDPAAVTLGQYDGYRDLDDVADDSDVETYASIEVRIDAEPWRGVPVEIVTGKALHEQRIAIVFTIRSDHAAGAGRIAFDVLPSPCISFELDVLDGDGHGIRTIEVAGRPDDDHGGLGDYATMLLSALNGERRHFATIDGILSGWRIVDPIRRRRPEVVRYARGSRGP